jgi:dolichyl-phosphate beta-glucosyltransferase
MQPAASAVNPDLSVIFPCYNEERRLPASLARVREYLDAKGWSYEIIVVDDGSSDGTAQAVLEAAAGDPRVQLRRYEPNRGKGYAVAHGALRARGRWVLFTDADLSTPIEELEKFLPELDRGFDVVIASRARAGSQLKVRQSWLRERAGRAVNLLIRLVSGMDFPDTQCGFKLFTHAAAQDIFHNLTIYRWMFDVEALVIARKLGYRAADVPVVWINSDDSRVNWRRDALRTLWELFRIYTYWLRRQPERNRREDGEVATQPTP